MIEHLSPDDAALNDARDSSRAAGLPDHEVASNQAKLLTLVCQMIGAKRVLEFGTLAGYSTIWFARAVGAQGHVTTLEVDPVRVQVSRANFERAGVAGRVELLEGPAAESSRRLVAAGVEPYDLVFIDADKPNSLTYLQAALALTHSGSVIIGDNIVRNGAVIDPESGDDRINGSRALIEAMGSDPRLDATALQTVGMKAGTASPSPACADHQPTSQARACRGGGEASIADADGQRVRRAPMVPTTSMAAAAMLPSAVAGPKDATEADTRRELRGSADE